MKEASEALIPIATRKFSFVIPITQILNNTLVLGFICTRIRVRDKILLFWLWVFLNHRYGFLDFNTFENKTTLPGMIFPDRKSKACLSDSWILKTQAKPIESMVVIIMTDSIWFLKTFLQPLKRCEAKFQTLDLKSRSEKANNSEQKYIISWFQRPQMGGCLFVGRRSSSVTKFWCTYDQILAPSQQN